MLKIIIIYNVEKNIYFVINKFIIDITGMPIILGKFITIFNTYLT